MAFFTKMLYALETNTDANVFSESELMCKIYSFVNLIT